MLRERTIWQIRIVALVCLVIFVGGSSQVLVNAVAASEKPPAIPPQYNIPSHINTMNTDGQAPRLHCPVNPLPYHALNRRIESYSASNAFRFRCIQATR